MAESPPRVSAEHKRAGSGDSPVRAGEIDTAAPFESVRAAVSLFGEKARKFPAVEKRATLDHELKHAQQDLKTLREQLETAEGVKAETLRELAAAKQEVEEKTRELEKVLASKPVANEENKTDGLPVEEVEKEVEAKGLAIQEEVKVVKARCDAATHDLELAKEEIGRLRLELKKSMEDTALIEERADVGTEIAAKHVEKLQEELSKALDSHGSVVEEAQHDTSVTEGSKSFPAKVNAILEALKEDLETHREVKAKLVIEVGEANLNLVKARAELEEARASEANAKEAAQSAMLELEDLSARLKVLTDERSSGSVLAESLRSEIANTKMELEASKEAEFHNTSADPGLSAELDKVRAELQATMAAEAKAKATVSSLTAALHKVTQEADEAKLVAEKAKERAHKAKSEAEQAKAATTTAESKLQAALKELEAAKAGQAMATSELKSLNERPADPPVSGEEHDGPTATAFEEEFHSLSKKLQETEELANKRVAAALAQVDAAKASEHEIIAKLEAAKLEIEANKLAVKQALQKAETAEAAKSAVENELRRRRKMADAAAVRGLTTADPKDAPEAGMQHLKQSHLAATPENKDASAESIQQLLQLKVSPMKTTTSDDKGSPEKPEKQNGNKNKKSTLIPMLGSYLSRKKSSLSS